MFGLKQAHIESINAVFAQCPNIEKVILYGSRAKGNYHNGSDIDLTLIGDELSFSLLSKLMIDLDDLPLAYTIDLSILHTIENQDLLDHIQRVGKVFYQKTK